MFGKIGAPELIIILVIALVIFGPSKLPEIGKALGKGIGEFKAHAKKITEDDKEDSSKGEDQEK